MFDWFHIARRLNHLKRVADAISVINPGQETAKAAIVNEVKRLRWRLWNGKASNVRISIDRIHAVMRHCQGEHGRKRHAAWAGKLWAASHALDQYLIGQTEWRVNYAGRYRAGPRVIPSITGGTANFLVNRRMNKLQQMRWSRRGADLLLQVRRAVYSGAFGSAFARDSILPMTRLLSRACPLDPPVLRRPLSERNLPRANRSMSRRRDQNPRFGFRIVRKLAETLTMLKAFSGTIPLTENRGRPLACTRIELNRGRELGHGNVTV